MILIVCVDDSYGMMFNSRRQSQDQVLRERILALTADSHLWMNSYSQKQFADMSAPQIMVDDSFLSRDMSGEYYFVEDASLLPYEKMIEKIIMFKWNRRYPFDLKFGISLDGWKLTQSEDFVGSSHEKITMEVWTK